MKKEGIQTRRRKSKKSKSPSKKLDGVESQLMDQQAHQTSLDEKSKAPVTRNSNI